MGVNDADYVVQKKTYLGRINGQHKYVLDWMCPYYNTWKNILARCYKYNKKVNKTYSDCKVCDDWLVFSNFKSWMEKQDWGGKYIDKDILVEGNKIYSPETCVFVDRETNNFFLERGKDRGKFLLGTYLDKETGKFKASLSFKGTRKTLGRFDSEEEAHLAWAIEKFKCAKILAKSQTDERISDAILKRYSKYLERAKNV